jgi:ABC-2 type transport system ATP-binding protein
LRGLPRAVLEARMDHLLRLFSLWEDRHVLLSSYSKGMRQKIMLSSALLHDPELLVLDEPFSGLDVNTGLILRSLIGALSREGKMIFYSSHVLETVEKVCTSVMILRKGIVVAHDKVENLRNILRQPSLEAVFTQLTQQEDPDRVVREIITAIRS